MARSSSVGHSDPDTRKRNSSIGALATMRGPAPRQQVDNTPTASVGRSAQPTASEPPPRDNAEFQERVKRNFEWTSSPEVQAALMQFAMGMTAPVNSPGDFLGNITNAIGGGFAAASRVHEGTLEEQTLAQEADLKEREMAVREGQLTINEKELGLKLHPNSKQSVVVKGGDAIDKKFGLGIPKGSSAKVEITVDEQGNLTNASVEAGFEGGGDADKSSPLEQLQKDRAEAEARGDKKAVAEIDLAISTSAAGTSGVGEGTIIVPDPDNPGEFIRKTIPDAKTVAEQEEAARLKDSRTAHGLLASATVQTATEQALEAIERNPMPNVFVTGLGGLMANLPLPTDAKAVRNYIDTIKSNITIEVLTAMRQASTTGAAFGNVSDFEGLMMQSAFGTLDQTGDSQVLADNIRRVNSTMKLIIDGDQVQRIGEQLKAEVLTHDQAVAEVQKLVNADVTKAAQTKKEMAQEQAREAARAGAGGETGRLNVPEGMLNPESLSGGTPPSLLDAPPAPRVELTPEEQSNIDIRKQMDELVLEDSKNLELADPVMPEHLTEREQIAWDDWSAGERRIYLKAKEQNKKKKNDPIEPSAGALSANTPGASPFSFSNMLGDLMAPIGQPPIKEIEGHNAPKSEKGKPQLRSSKQILKQAKELKGK